MCSSDLIAGTDYPITEKEYLGKVEYVIPQVGYITQILQPPINYIIIAVIIGVMAVKHFADKEKKKMKFQYTKDSSEVNESVDTLEKNQEKSTDDILDKKIYDDLDKTLKKNSDSVYTKSSESTDDDKKEI